MITTLRNGTETINFNILYEYRLGMNGSENEAM